MCETKMEREVDSDDVQAKAKAACEFCSRASEYTENNGGKPWKYVIIPHTLVKRDYTFGYVIAQTKLNWNG